MKMRIRRNAILLLFMGIMPFALIDPITGSMMEQGNMMGQSDMIGNMTGQCLSMECKTMMETCPENTTCMMMQSMKGNCPENMTCIMMRPLGKSCPDNMTCVMVQPMGTCPTNKTCMMMQPMMENCPENMTCMMMQSVVDKCPEGADCYTLEQDQDTGSEVQARLDCAEYWLKKATELHELHLRDASTTTNESQIELMDQITKALECVTGENVTSHRIVTVASDQTSPDEHGH